MASNLRKCVSFGVAGTMNPGPGQPQDLEYVSGAYPNNGMDNLAFIADTNTKWVKIWVHLPTLWPSSGTIDSYRLDRLDYQIALAKVYGCGVILTIDPHLPSWINGSSNSLQAPSDTTLGGPWTQMVNYLVTRYNYNNASKPYAPYGYVDILEAFNEPNRFWVPNSSADTTITVADLFFRAKQIISYYGNTPLIAGPALLDSDPARSGNGGANNYYSFADSVLTRLSYNGFYNVGNNVFVIWTQHNYADVCHDQGSGTVAPDRATWYSGDSRYDRYHLRTGQMCALLAAHGWNGWPGPGNADLFCTEGGAYSQVVVPDWGLSSQADFLNYQAWLVYRNLQRLANDSEGAGIGMMTNYLFYTDPAYDSGMLENPPPAAYPRSLYLNTWRPFPGRL